MSNVLKIWRGAQQPRQTNPTGQPTPSTIFLYRGAVEPSQPSAAAVTAKITGSSIFSIDVDVTGRPQEYELP